MKIYLTYFYNIRFLKPNQIPVSTAVWDPKWFHNGGSNDTIFIDKNGVINGLRIEELNPGYCHAEGCPCKYQKTQNGYQKCKFLKSYRVGLRCLNFQTVYEKLENIARQWKEFNNLSEDPEIVLIVYETPDNPCSERVPLFEWFEENGIKLEEWTNAVPD